MGQLGWTRRTLVECSACPCLQEALRNYISTLGSSGWWELTRGYLNTNSEIRRILLPDSGPLAAHRHCPSGSGHQSTVVLWKGDHTHGLVTWHLPTRTQNKSLPWFGSRKTLSLQTSCCLLPSTQRAWLRGLPWSTVDKGCVPPFPSGVRGGTLGLEGAVAHVSSLVMALVFLLQSLAGVYLARGGDLHQQQPCPPTPVSTESRTRGAELASGQWPPWQCCLSLLSWFLCL